MLSTLGSAVVLSAVSGGGTLADLSVRSLFLGQIPLWIAYSAGPLVSCRLADIEPVEMLGLKMRWRDVPIGGVIGLAVQFPLIPILYWPILKFLVDADPGAAAEELIARANASGDRILLFFMIVVFAPLVEELFYRGLLLGVLRNLTTDVMAVTITAALFAVLHFQPLQAPGLFVFGLIAGALRVKYNRLGPSWAMHAAFNGLTFLILVT